VERAAILNANPGDDRMGRAIENSRMNIIPHPVPGTIVPNVGETGQEIFSNFL
jgi:hypothetical protein